MDQMNIDNTQQNFEPPKKKGANKKVMVVAVGLLVALVLGLAGWKWHGQISEYQMKQNYADQQIGQLQKQVDDLKAAQAVTSSSTNTGDSAQQYLEVKEWGIKLKATSSPMSYVITKNSGNNTEAAWLTNTDAQALQSSAEDKTCNQKNSDGTPNHWYLAVVTRSKTKLDGFYADRTPQKIGEYYYYAERSNGLCSKPEATSKEAKLAAELYASAQTVLESK